MNDLPKPVAELVDVLAVMPGAVAVVLGGSHALGSNDAGVTGTSAFTIAAKSISRRSKLAESFILPVRGGA